MFDLTKTSRLAELFQVERSQRTAGWVEAFYDTAWHASLQVADPPFFEGPDGYTYLRLHFPEPGKSFASNSLSNVAPFVNARGTGAAIFNSPGASDPEFVLSMGRLDSLLSYDSWHGDPQDPLEVVDTADGSSEAVDGLQSLTLEKKPEVLVGAPSAAILPAHTARMLHGHLTLGWQLQDPRVALMMIPGVAPSRSLVLGKKMSAFADVATATRQVQALL